LSYVILSGRGSGNFSSISSTAFSGLFDFTFIRILSGVEDLFLGLSGVFFFGLSGVLFFGLSGVFFFELS